VSVLVADASATICIVASPAGAGLDDFRDSAPPVSPAGDCAKPLAAMISKLANRLGKCTESIIILPWDGVHGARAVVERGQSIVCRARKFNRFSEWALSRSIQNLSMTTNIQIGALCLAALLLASCATPAKQIQPPAALGPQARQVPIFSGHDGRSASWSALIEAAARADAVIVGENHGHPLGLAFAAELWRDILAHNSKAALSLEFFERDEQSRLDDYLSGLSDEKTFRTRTGRNDGNYPPGHSSMVEAARAASRPVIAANAPRPYVRLVRKESFEALSKLTPEQRRLIRVPDELATGKYREDFDKVMTPSSAPAHGETTPDPAARRTQLDAVFRSQQSWDWTMAESIANALAAEAHPVVHVVGRFHSDFDGGLIQALRKLRPGVRVLTISVAPADSNLLREDDRGRADFVAYVGK